MSDSTPDLAAPYAWCPGLSMSSLYATPRKLDVEPVRTIAPPVPRSTMPGTTACSVKKTPDRLVAIVSCQALTRWACGPVDGRIPALAQTRSIVPNRSSAWATAAFTCSSSRTSPMIPRNSRPESRTIFSVSARSSGVLIAYCTESN